MPNTLRTLLRAARVTALVQLALGVALWSGHAVPWRGVHMTAGVLLGALLIALGAAASRRSSDARAVVIAAAWTALLAGYGFAHARFMPGPSHWVAQLLHALTGLATLGVAERLARPARGAAVPNVA